MIRRMIVMTAALAAALTAGSAGGQPAKDAHPSSLVEPMLVIQSHHAKLWLAGRARNWDLADYQIDELKEALEDAGKKVPDYKGVPVGSMIENLMLPPIADVENAIKARDHIKFAATFDSLTGRCNACHRGANRGFIVIQRPAGSTFSNQSFTSKKK